MTTNPGSNYLEKQRHGFSEQLGKGHYGPMRRCAGSDCNFFLNVLRDAMGQRWSSQVELNILECGVGDGIWLDAIREHRNHGVTKASGFDVTPEMVFAAHQRFNSQVNNQFKVGFLKVGDITNLQAFSPGKEVNKDGGWHDLVYAYDVLQQLPESLRLSATKHMIAATKLGGVVVIFDRQRFSAHGIKMSCFKWITSHTHWKPVPEFYLLARYPNMTKLARKIRNRWGCKTCVVADRQRVHFALVIHVEKKVDF